MSARRDALRLFFALCPSSWENVSFKVMERTICVVPGLSAIDRNRFIQEFADTLWVHRAREMGSAKRCGCESNGQRGNEPARKRRWREWKG